MWAETKEKETTCFHPYHQNSKPQAHPATKRASKKPLLVLTSPQIVRPNPTLPPPKPPPPRLPDLPPPQASNPLAQPFDLFLLLNPPLISLLYASRFPMRVEMRDFLLCAWMVGGCRVGLLHYRARNDAAGTVVAAPARQLYTGGDAFYSCGG